MDQDIQQTSQLPPENKLTVKDLLFKKDPTIYNWANWKFWLAISVAVLAGFILAMLIQQGELFFIVFYIFMSLGILIPYTYGLRLIKKEQLQEADHRLRKYKLIISPLIIILVAFLLFLIFINNRSVSQYSNKYQPQYQNKIYPSPTPNLYPESTNSAVPANWKMYQNGKYRYALQVPDDWREESDYEDAKGEWYSQSFSPRYANCEDSLQGCIPAFYIMVYPRINTENKSRTLKEYFDFLYNQPIGKEIRIDKALRNSPSIIKVLERLVIDGERAVRLTLSIPPEFDGIDTPGTSEQIYTFKNNKIYALGSVRDASIEIQKEISNTKTILQMISTFKFIQ